MVPDQRGEVLREAPASFSFEEDPSALETELCLEALLNSIPFP
jgi:hypothetical protein